MLKKLGKKVRGFLKRKKEKPYVFFSRNIKSISDEELKNAEKEDEKGAERYRRMGYQTESKDGLKFKNYGELDTIKTIQEKGIEPRLLTIYREGMVIPTSIELETKDKKIININRKKLVKSLENYIKDKGKITKFLKKNNLNEITNEKLVDAYQKGKISSEDLYILQELNHLPKHIWDISCSWFGYLDGPLRFLPLTVELKKEIENFDKSKMRGYPGDRGYRGIIKSKEVESIILQPPLQKRMLEYKLFKNISKEKVDASNRFTYKMMKRTNKTIIARNKAKKIMDEQREPIERVIKEVLKTSKYITPEQLAAKLNVHPEITYYLLAMKSQDGELKGRRVITFSKDKKKFIKERIEFYKPSKFPHKQNKKNVIS